MNNAPTTSRITIHGRPLTKAEEMTLGLALQMLAFDFTRDPTAMGDDERSMEVTALHAKVAEKLRDELLKPMVP